MTTTKIALRENRKKEEERLDRCKKKHMKYIKKKKRLRLFKFDYK